jgi:lysozyme
VDVSAYQGQVDWPTVRANGIAFAFARASDGTGVPDSTFARNWRDMGLAGIVRGAYQFFRPEEDPVAQAGFFLATLDAAGGWADRDLPPVLDVEVADTESASAIRKGVGAWLDSVRAATGRGTILYLSPGFGAELGGAFADEPLWVAHWDVACPALPAGWTNWTFWQSSDRGAVPGIPGAVDVDEFNGSQPSLEALARARAKSPADDAGLPGDARIDVGGGEADRREGATLTPGARPRAPPEDSCPSTPEAP